MDPSAAVVVHALLVCRSVSTSPNGDVGIEGIVEILPVDKLPGDVGPLTFLALVRNLVAGPGRGAFLVRTPGPAARDIARCPLEVTVPKGYEGRQLALQVRVPSLPVPQGGWYEVIFEWAGRALAANRFAVGARGSAAPQAPRETPGPAGRPPAAPGP